MNANELKDYILIEGTKTSIEGKKGTFFTNEDIDWVVEKILENLVDK